MVGGEEEEGEDEDGGEGEGGVEEDAAGGFGMRATPVGGFGAVGEADLVLVFEVVGELVGGGVAVAGFAFEGAVEDLLQLRGDGGFGLHGRLGVADEAGVHDGEGVGAGEGELAGEHLVEHDAEGVDVAAGVAALAFDLLGGDVVGRAHALREVGVGEAARAGVGGDAEVDEADAIGVVDHDVFGLEVAVDDAVGVDVFERVGDAEGEFGGALGRELAELVEDAAEELAFDPLHDHVGLRLAGGGEDLHDAGVVEAGADVGFALEALVGGGVALDAGVGHLDGDLCAGDEVGGAEDGGHAAGGDEAVEPVVVELVAGLDGGGRSGHLEQPVGASAVEAHALDFADADELDADVVVAAGGVGCGDERGGGLVERGVGVDGALNDGVGDVAVEAVGAEQEDVAGHDVDGDGVGGDEELVAEGAGEEMAVCADGGLGFGEDAEADLLIDHGVVAGELAGGAVAEEVAAGVACVGDDGGVEAQGAGDDGGGHAGAAGDDGAAGVGIFVEGAGAGVALVVDGLVGVLHEFGQEGDVHDAFGDLAEAGHHGLDGDARGDFAALLAAYAVGEGEEPSLGLDLGGRGGEDVADEVFVVIAGPAGIG